MCQFQGKWDIGSKQHSGQVARRRRDALYSEKTMKKSALIFWLAASVGCYHFRTSPKDSAPATEPQTATVWSYAWGLAQNRVEVDMPSCPSRALQEVTVSSNFGFALLTIVTLG